MARKLEITVPADQTDELLAAVKRLDGVVGIRLQRSVSITPAGDQSRHARARGVAGYTSHWRGCKQRSYQLPAIQHHLSAS